MLPDHWGEQTLLFFDPEKKFIGYTEVSTERFVLRVSRGVFVGVGGIACSWILQNGIQWQMSTNVLLSPFSYLERIPLGMAIIWFWNSLLHRDWIRSNHYRIKQHVKKYGEPSTTGSILHEIFLQFFPNFSLWIYFSKGAFNSIRQWLFNQL